jgi:hypothetical protein
MLNRAKEGKEKDLIIGLMENNPQALITDESEYAKVVQIGASRLGKVAKNPATINKLGRNWYQIKNSDAVFAIVESFYTRPDTGNLDMANVSGGTGWAIAYAAEKIDGRERPIYVFNQSDNKWYQYDYIDEIFKEYSGIPKLTKNFAGIGTRKINEAGKKAIDNLYANTFGAIQPSSSVKPIVKDLTRWSELSAATTPYTDKGIVVTRIANTDEHFGNPFIGSKRRDKQGNIVESKVDNITTFNTIDEADQAYRDWLMGTKHQNIQPKRREWILKQINEGKLDGKTLLYYKPMEVTNNDGTVIRGGYHSHADTLAEVVEQLRSTQPSTQPTQRKTYSGKVTSLQPNQIFVFGSNPEGKHGAGAAKYAKDNFGATSGQGEGLQGKSYALPTKDLRVKENNSLRSISPEDITSNIKKLYDVARQNPTKEFLVSDYSESNLNGYSGQEMAYMFSNAGPIPSNIVFNENFDKLITTQPSTQPVVTKTPLQTPSITDAKTPSVEQAKKIIDQQLAKIEEVLSNPENNVIMDNSLLISEKTKEIAGDYAGSKAIADYLYGEIYKRFGLPISGTGKFSVRELILENQQGVEGVEADKINKEDLNGLDLDGTCFRA